MPVSVQEQYFEVLEQIDRLAGFHGDSVAERDLIDGIEQRLARFDAAVRLAEYDADDSGSSLAQARAAELRQSVRLGYRRFQEAQQAAVQAQQAHWRAQREKLYSPAAAAAAGGAAEGPPGGAPSAAGGSSDEPAASKSEDITATLRRVHQMAQGEVLKAEINVEELDGSTKTLRDLEDKYSAVDVLLTGSRKLVKLLDEADRGDRRRMQLALSFLAAVVMWILWRRIFKLPVKLLWFGIVRLVRAGLWATRSKSESLPVSVPASSLSASSLSSVALPSSVALAASVTASLSSVTKSLEAAESLEAVESFEAVESLESVTKSVTDSLSADHADAVSEVTSEASFTHIVHSDL